MSVVCVLYESAVCACCVLCVCCVCVVSLCARNDSLIHLLCEYLRSMGKNGLWVHKKTRCSLRYQIRYAARILLQRGKKEYKIVTYST